MHLASAARMLLLQLPLKMSLLLLLLHATWPPTGGDLQKATRTPLPAGLEPQRALSPLSLTGALRRAP